MFDAPPEPGSMGNPRLRAMLSPLVVKRIKNYPYNRQPWHPERELRRTGCPMLPSHCKHVVEAKEASACAWVINKRFDAKEYTKRVYH